MILMKDFNIIYLSVILQYIQIHLKIVIYKFTDLISQSIYLQYILYANGGNPYSKLVLGIIDLLYKMFLILKHSCDIDQNCQSHKRTTSIYSLNKIKLSI
jgi:hypothetical protein